MRNSCITYFPYKPCKRNVITLIFFKLGIFSTVKSFGKYISFFIGYFLNNSYLFCPSKNSKRKSIAIFTFGTDISRTCFRNLSAEIADEYEKKYPTICKAIHKENGGHGDAVMFGLRAATGEFFKVVDSDDYLDEKSFLEVLNKLKEFIRDKENIDMLLWRLKRLPML